MRASPLARAALVGALIAAASLGAGPAAAEPRPLTFKARLNAGPLVGIHLGGGGGWFTSVEGSASVTLDDLVEIELGGAHVMTPIHTGGSFVARAGYTPVVHDTRAAGKPGGWVIAPTVLFGYRFVLLDNSCDESCLVDRLHTLTAASGIDVTYWANEHWGFVMRPLIQMDLLLDGWRDNSTDPQYSREIDAGGPILGGTFYVGVAF